MPRPVRHVRYKTNVVRLSKSLLGPVIYLTSPMAGHQEVVEGEEAAAIGTFNATSTYRQVAAAVVVVEGEEEAAAVAAAVAREWW